MRSKAARMPRPSGKRLAMAALETVKLAHLADRPAPRLSGGQQQRVAIARAMVGRPQVLLFDEPLSESRRRACALEMRSELRRIQRQIGLSSIYVTHDQAEALAVSDWIVVMKEGRIVERGRPLDIYRYPRHVFTAQFLGSTNLIAGTVAECGRRARPARRDDAARPHRRHRPAAARSPPAPRCSVSIRPEDLSTQAPADTGARAVNAFDGTPRPLRFSRAWRWKLSYAAARSRLQCLLNREADLTPGRAITVRAKADACLVLPEE